MSSCKYEYKKLNTYLIFVSLVLSLLIYFNKVYNKEIYVYKFNSLNYKKISKDFFDYQIKNISLEDNAPSLEDYEKFFKKEITNFFSKYYFFTNTLSNNVMYDPNDVDLFAISHFLTEGKIDFKKKKIFYETFKNHTNYDEFLTIDISGENFKKQNNFYLKYARGNFFLFASQEEFENTKKLIEFSKNLISYSVLEKRHTLNPFLNNYLKIIHTNLVNEKINLKKISIFYKLMFHSIVLIFLISSFFLVLKFVLIVTNFIKFKFYDHEIDGNLIN
jgi:hypothetical protein